MCPTLGRRGPGSLGCVSTGQRLDHAPSGVVSQHPVRPCSWAKCGMWAARTWHTAGYRAIRTVLGGSRSAPGTPRGCRDEPGEDFPEATARGALRHQRRLTPRVLLSEVGHPPQFTSTVVQLKRLDVDHVQVLYRPPRVVPLTRTVHRASKVAAGRATGGYDPDRV